MTLPAMRQLCLVKSGAQLEDQPTCLSLSGHAVLMLCPNTHDQQRSA